MPWAERIECFSQHTHWQLWDDFHVISFICVCLCVCVRVRELCYLPLKTVVYKSILHCFFASWKQVQRKAKIWGKHQAWGKEKKKD